MNTTYIYIVVGCSCEEMNYSEWNIKAFHSAKDAKLYASLANFRENQLPKENNNELPLINEFDQTCDRHPQGSNVYFVSKLEILGD